MVWINVHFSLFFLQLTVEDETFLAENVTATLSQFEKITADLGEL